MYPRRRDWKRVGKVAAWTLGPMVVVVIGIMGFPASIPDLPEPREVPLTFDEARKTFDYLLANEPFTVNEVCLPILLHHDRPTPRVYVLLHGLSNCPAQFRRIATALHAAGHTVLVPRMPHHGMKDRLTDDFGKLTLQETADWLGGNLEIARGLGQEVIVAGLSVNGSTATWIAQKRPDVARVMVIAPFYAPAGIPGWLEGPLGRLLSRLPNVFIWWDATQKQDIPGPPYAYPRFPTRVVGDFMVLGHALKSMTTKQAPVCKNLQMVWSDADAAIDLVTTRQIAAQWKAWPEVRLQEYVFPADLKVPHDMVDPNQPNQQIAISEPVLLKLLESELNP